MARLITGFTIERRRVSILAPAHLSPAQCDDADDQCCSEDPDPGYGVGGELCCPEEDLTDEIGAEATGPIGRDGAECSESWTLTRTTDTGGIVWVGSSDVDVAPGDCQGVGVTAKVWCQKGANGEAKWFVVGSYTAYDLEEYNYGPYQLLDEGDGFLTAIHPVPGEEDPLVLTFDRPCTGGGGGGGSGGARPCEEALVLEVGELSAPQFIDGTEGAVTQFFAVDLNVMESYYYQVTVTNFNNPTESTCTSTYYHGGCNDLVGMGGFNITGNGTICLDFFTDPTVRFGLVAVAGSSYNYTIEVIQGTCP